MKNLLIIYPHWPPSNLVGVHRPRLVANYLPEFGWHPIVLTVNPDYYEEPHDGDLCKTVLPKIEVIHVKAFKVTRPRIVGDIGLRAFPFLYKMACEIIRSRKIDFIWIPIPSFYTALLGRALYEKFKIPYGIDYIDPWVRDISTRRDWRHRLSNLAAKILEPIAIKKASLISGVAYEYFKPVLFRNFRHSNDGGKDMFFKKSTNQQIHTVAFPYGFDPNDHKIKLDGIEYPWKDLPNCKPIVYAGAFLPKSRLFAEALFQSIDQLRKAGQLDKDLRFYFLGTGAYQGESIQKIAERCNVGNLVVEIRDRFPFLYILNYLSAASAVLILGSVEKHYTASKTFQALLSGRPVIAVLHEATDTVRILTQCNAENFIALYRDMDQMEDMRKKITKAFKKFTVCSQDWQPDLTKLDKYSSKVQAGKLTETLGQILLEGMTGQPPLK